MFNTKSVSLGSKETGILLIMYSMYVFLCAIYSKIMDMCYPSYGKSAEIGFADMAAATTSFETQDQSNRPTIDGFEACKQARKLANHRTLVSRQLIGAILRGEVQMSTLMADGEQTSSADGGDQSLSEGLSEGQRSTGQAKGTSSGTVENQKYLHAFNSHLFDTNVKSLAKVDELEVSII